MTNRALRILIQCGNHFENQIRVHILARALLELGHEPIVLLYTPGKGDVFRAEGIRRCYTGEYLGPSRLPRSIALSSPIAHGLSVDRLIEIERRRRPRIGWPGQSGRTLADGYRYLTGIDRLLDDIQPDRVVVWNGFTGYVANTLRLLCQARSIEHAFIERGPRRDSIYLDSRGVNGDSSLAQLEAADFMATPATDPGLDDVQRFLAPNLSEPAPPPAGNKTLIFFPLQVALDTNILLYSPFASMRQAFLAIHAYFAGPGVRFVVRPHPEEEPGKRPNIPLLDDVEIRSDGSVREWLDAADLVTTINSTIGLESIVAGTPVCAFGTSIYSRLCARPAPNRPLADYRVAPPLVASYLQHLLGKHLLIAGKPSNREAVRAQLNLPAGAPQNLDVQGSRRSWPELLGDIATRCEEIRFDLDVDFARNLDLTYRDHRVGLTRERLMRQLAPDLAPERVRLRPKVSGTRDIGEVLVVDEGWSGPNPGYAAIVNVYGTVLTGGPAAS